jgi:hypothetical protein
MAAPPLDSPCDGPVTYPGDINTLIKSSKGKAYILTNLTKFKYWVAVVMQQRNVKGLTVGQYVPLLFSNFVPNINGGSDAFCSSRNLVPTTELIL